VTRKVTLQKTILINIIRIKIRGSIRVMRKKSIMLMQQMIKEIKRNRFRVDTSSSSDDGLFFISALIGTISQDDDISLIDSGASKHMTGNRASLKEVKEKNNTSLKVELEDNSKY